MEQNFNNGFLAERNNFKFEDLSTYGADLLEMENENINSHLATALQSATENEKCSSTQFYQIVTSY